MPGASPSLSTATASGSVNPPLLQAGSHAQWVASLYIMTNVQNSRFKSMRTSSILGLLLALTLVACRYPNEFRNTPRDASHAVLRGGDNLFASHINRQPTSFWRCGDAFRIPAGTNEVRVAYSDRRETIGYESPKFIATAGGEYAFTRKREPSLTSPFTAAPHPTTSHAWVILDRRDRVTIEQRNGSGPRRVVAEASREGYVFGVSSADEAIAEYHRKNP